MRPSVHSFVFLATLSSSVLICPAKAGFFDVRVTGRITSDDSGKSLSFAPVSVLSSNVSVAAQEVRTDADGNYTLVLHSGASGFAFGDRTLVFDASDHQPRRMVLELSFLQKTDPGLCWHIRCDVSLKALGGASKAAPLLLDTCAWEPVTATFRWKEAWAGKAFPIERSLDEELRMVEARLMARGEGLMIYGLTVDQWTSVPLPGTTILLRTEAGDVVRDTTLRADGGGRYALLLPYGALYRMEVGGPGHVHKIMEFDLTYPGLGAVPGGFGANVDVRLFGPLPGEDLSFLSGPMGRMTFDPQEEIMAWDMERVVPLKQRLEAILARHRPK